MKKYKYIGESDELTTNGKIYEVDDDGTFIDDTMTKCGLSNGFEKHFELIKEDEMTTEERLVYIDIALRAGSIQLHKDTLETVVKIIDLVDKKKGDTDIKDILEIIKK